MPTISISWENPNYDIDETRVYKSDSPFDETTLPNNVITLLPTETILNDADIVGRDEPYYYMIGLYRSIDDNEVFSDLIIAQSQLTNNADVFGDGSTLIANFFNNNVDDSASGLPVTINGSVTYTEGVVDNAIVFDGPSYVEVNYSSLTNPSITSHSLWVRFDTADLNYTGRILSYYNSSGTVNTLVVNAGNVHWVVGNRAVINVDLPSGLMDGKFHHFVCNSEGKELYVNGVLQTSSSSESRTSHRSTGTIVYGEGYSGQDFIGSIDQARMFNKTLTQYDVSILYSER